MKRSVISFRNIVEHIDKVAELSIRLFVLLGILLWGVIIMSLFPLGIYSISLGGIGGILTGVIGIVMGIVFLAVYWGMLRSIYK